VRMVAASFLVKNLLIDWRLGEQWFWDTLVDADGASNPFNWQWVAGSGADAAPYFRIFNPELQAKKFDPDGHYVRAWAPEHASAEAGDAPEPIVDLRATRNAALDAYEKVKQAARSR
jgi:deoxyribodipyrimidine photo-lyase